MSLGLSLNNALSGLLASQQSMAVISQNIANANNEDYSRQQVRQSSVSTGGQIGNGVRIEEVSRTVDEYIGRTVVTRSSDVARANAINEFYDQAQLFFGSPGQSNSIDVYVADFFENLRTLEATPEEPSLKFNAVNSAVTLAAEVSSLARNIENLRFDADQQIGSAVDNINFNLRKLQDLNTSILSSGTSGESKNVLYDEVDAALKDIAKEINISYYFDNNGAVVISTSNGIPLLENGLYQLQYTKSSSVDDLINNNDLSAITVAFVRPDGTLDTNNPFEISSSGSRDTVLSVLSSGNVRGLLDIRDNLFVNTLEQLDELAETITNEVNRIHNDGVSFPPPNSLTGTTLVDPNDADVWSGSFTIQALNADGSPVSSPYNSRIPGYEPLTLDMGALSDSNGVVGQASYQAILDEINEHFGPAGTRVGFNDANGSSLLHNIELVPLSDSLTAGTGTFNFALETNNLSGSDVTYRVTNVVPSDGGIVVSGIPGGGTNFTSTAGAKEIDSGMSVGLNMAGAGAGPYTVDVTVEVDDGNGGTYTDTITYTINESANDLYRNRIAATSISGGGDANLELPNTSQGFLTATLVDANGNEVAKDPTTGDYLSPGYLRITGVGDNRFGITEGTSNHVGDTAGGVNATNFGFSHHMGLNNFFVDDGTTQGSAIEMAVRADIEATPGALSVGRLGASPQPISASGQVNNTFEVSKGSNQAIVSMSDLVLAAVSFDEAGGLPAASLSISSFAAEILGFNAAIAADAQEDARKESLILQGFEDRNDAIRGVNIDEELANTIIFQNAYAANARVISVTGELFDSLLNSF